MAIVDAMIQILAQQVFTALQTQAHFALDFKGQFEVMKTRLDLTKALLADTENLKNKKEIVKTSLSTLRELVYEADNILTDCIISDEYQNDGSCSSLTFQKPLFWYNTGKKLKDINAKMDTMERSLAAYLQAKDLSNRGDDAYQVVKFTTQDCDPSEIIGLKHDLQKLKDWIFGTTNVLHRVGIVGMGGLGKTTIAQKIFNDEEVATRYQKMLWVSVSQTFSENRIMRSMLEQLEPNFSISDESLMMHKINQALEGKTCLIFMDDVWRMNLPWWDKFCSSLQKVIGGSSCIIITTRNEDVATDMGVDKSQIHQPKTLNKDDSWLLFSKFAFSRCREKRCPDPQFEKEGREILDKCGGLPLAIKTVAALLAPKANSLVQWNEINKNFHELTVEGKISSVMASLQLSYDELPTHLKQCLLCFSIYPEDSEIHAEQLIHWWVGEGLIQGKGSKTAKEMGFDYLSDLVARCLVEAVHRRDYDGRVYVCRMHDMVRELTIKIAEEESFGKFDEQSRQIPTVNSRWLGITSAMDPKSVRSSTKLRALLLIPSSKVVLARNIGSFSSLRVLDFSLISKPDDIPVKDFLAWICSLKRLAYLNLSGFLSIKELPSSMRKLRNLQILILCGCSNLVTLNPYITTLKKLVVLDLGSCGLEYLPKRLGSLLYLQELSGFRVSNQANRQSFRFHELRGLSHLRVLRMSIGNDTAISQEDRDVLSQLSKLKVLAIDAEDCEGQNILEMLNALSPPPSLQEFYLRRYRHKTLPAWINPEKLSSLQYLCIENGDLEHIETSPRWVAEIQYTWNIEGLCFKVLPNLNINWKNLEKDMPLLRYAEVSGCFNLQHFPCPDEKLAVWRKNED